MHSHDTDHSGTVRQIRPFLPVQRGSMRISNIISINAILYATENGCKWHALPKRFGNWFTVYAWFRRWYRSGVLEHLFAKLREWQVVGEDTECFGLGRTGARKTNGPQSFGPDGSFVI